MIAEHIVANAAVQDALAQWDKGEREKPVHVFLRQLSGSKDPLRLHPKWFAHLRAVACRDDRALFEEVLRSAAQHIILQDENKASISKAR